MSARRQSLKEAAELLRKGASLLKEPCPQCGGVLLFYQGSYLCPTCGAVAEKAAELSQKSTKTSQKDVGELEVLSLIEKAILSKLTELSSRSQSSSNLDEELKYVDLLKAYLELLNLVKQVKLGKSGA
jgi:UPF0148 protein